MRSLRAIFRLRARAELQYRGAVIGGVLCQMIFGLILIAVYRALYDTKPQTLPLSSVVTYVWLQQAFFRILLSNDSELSEKIGSGSIAYDLCRPVSVYGYYYARDAANRLVASALRAVPMLVFAFLLPEGWRIEAPASIAALCCSMVSLFLGLLCVCALNSIARGFTLLTLDNKGIEAMMNLLLTIFAGNVLPLTLYPDSWQWVIRLLPYAQMLDAPARIYSGTMTLAEVPAAWLLQIVWTLILGYLGIRLWRKNEKRLVLQGG